MEDRRTLKEEEAARVSGGEKMFESKGLLITCLNCWYQIPVESFPVDERGIPLPHELTCPACGYTFSITG